MTNPFLRTLIVSAGYYVLQVALMMAQGRANQPEVLGEKMGMLIVPFLATAVWAWVSKKPWPWWRYIVTFVLVALVTGILF